jgi:parallel beta-helix repeat protein
MAIMATLACTAVPGMAAVITVTTTIQDAVNAAQPGDRIVVPPGTYHESVDVTTNDLSIVGSRGAVLDAGGFTNGIHVGGDGWITGPDGFPACPPVAVDRFTLKGLTIEHAQENGIFLSAVGGYQISGGKYVDNGEYGIFPNCSNDGQINANEVNGGKDTCIYVGDDVDVTITANHATGCTVGVQIVSSENIKVTADKLTGNTAGILAIVDPFNPFSQTTNVTIEENLVSRNNLPNQADNVDLQRLPPGTGILNVGSDQLTISRNIVNGNRTFGLAILRNQFAIQSGDPRINPNPDDNQTRENIIINNGGQPFDQLPGADIFYDGSGTGNCFSDNVFKTSTPPDIEAIYPCQ